MTIIQESTRREWFTTGTSLDPRTGGKIIFRWKDWGLDHFTGEIPGSVVEFRRPERFVFRWRADSGSYETTAEFSFETAEEGTLVHVRESGYEDSPEGMRDLLNRVSGCAHVLTLLRFYLEHSVRYKRNGGGGKISKSSPPA